MPHRIVRLLESVLRWLFPTSGRHRSAGRLFTPVTPDPPTLTLRRPFATGPSLRLVALVGEDVPLSRVRPYVLTPEERRERRLRRVRRRSLWLATHGIDSGPRLIHGVEVPR